MAQQAQDGEGATVWIRQTCQPAFVAASTMVPKHSDLVLMFVLEVEVSAQQIPSQRIPPSSQIQTNTFPNPETP